MKIRDLSRQSLLNDLNNHLLIFVTHSRRLVYIQRSCPVRFLLLGLFSYEVRITFALLMLLSHSDISQSYSEKGNQLRLDKKVIINHKFYVR